MARFPYVIVNANVQRYNVSLYLFLSKAICSNKKYVFSQALN
jgi:hypothetical protein